MPTADRVLVFGARPSRIVADVRIDMAHPRDPNAPTLRDDQDEVIAVLSVEVDKSVSVERNRKN